MINRDIRGHSYCDVRGEILGSSQDGQKRKHLPNMFSLIKKAIRYRPSSNHKQRQPVIRRNYSDDSAGSFRESKAFGFRGMYGYKAET